MDITQDAANTMQNFIDLLDSVEKKHCELIDLIKELEAEQVDLLHEFEFDTFHRTEGHRKARRLQHVRRERRAAKDTMELFFPIKEFAKSHRGLKKSIQDVLTQIEKIKITHENRVYKARSEKDCEVADKHYDSVTINLDDKLVDIANKRKKRFA